MPEDYEGFPQRRDFPVGGEPVLFTYNEENSYGKWHMSDDTLTRRPYRQREESITSPPSRPGRARPTSC